MVRLSVKLGDKSGWVKVFDPRDRVLFVASDETPAVGEAVRVDLIIGDKGPRVILRGTVVSRHEQPTESLPAGCAVAVGDDDREKINYLNGFVRGGMLDLRRRRRLPVRLRVAYQTLNGLLHSFTRDINEEGLFVVTEDPLPEDTRVGLALTIPDRIAPLELTGFVSHTVLVEDEDVPGMGIILELGVDAQRELSEIVDQLERGFLTGELPDDLLM